MAVAIKDSALYQENLLWAPGLKGAIFIYKKIFKGSPRSPTLES